MGDCKTARLASDDDQVDTGPEFLVEFNDMYGYPVKPKNDGGYEVGLYIGSDIHNQHAYARLPEKQVRAFRGITHRSGASPTAPMAVSDRAYRRSPARPGPSRIRWLRISDRRT